MRLLLLLALLALLPLLGYGEEPLPPFPSETADSFPGITALPRVADRPPLRVAALGDPQDLTEPLLPDGLAPPGQPPQEFSPPAGRKLPPGAKPGPLQQLIFTATELPRLGDNGLGLTWLETSQQDPRLGESTGRVTSQCHAGWGCPQKQCAGYAPGGVDLAKPRLPIFQFRRLCSLAVDVARGVIYTPLSMPAPVNIPGPHGEHGNALVSGVLVKRDLYTQIGRAHV